jgi:hypothetical protein
MLNIPEELVTYASTTSWPTPPCINFTTSARTGDRFKSFGNVWATTTFVGLGADTVSAKASGIATGMSVFSILSAAGGARAPLKAWTASTSGVGVGLVSPPVQRAKLKIPKLNATCLKFLFITWP